MNQSELDQFHKERKSENICDVCGLTMKITKRKRLNKNTKERTFYSCLCGNKFRKRTGNEILRDLGLKD